MNKIRNKRKTLIIIGTIVLTVILSIVMDKYKMTKDFVVTTTTKAQLATPSMSPTTSVVESNDKININTATKSELQSLPGIGDKISDRIIQYRDKNGNFEVIQDIMKVAGIGDEKFKDIKVFIDVK